MNRRQLTDDDSSMIVRFDATVKRPAHLPPTCDARLLALDEEAAWSMCDLMHRFKVQSDGTAFWNPPTPKVARQALDAWIIGVGCNIAAKGLHDAVIEAMFPVPPAINYDQVYHFWMAKELPDLDVLTHVLFGIGLGPHTVTGAVLLRHRAALPITGEHETSDIKRKPVRV